MPLALRPGVEASQAEPDQEQAPERAATPLGRLRARFPGVLEPERGQGQEAMPLAKLAVLQASRAEQAPGLDQALAATPLALLLARSRVEREQASGREQAVMQPEQAQTLMSLAALEQAMGQDMAAPSSKTHSARRQTPSSR